MVEKSLAWLQLGQDDCLKFPCKDGTDFAMKFRRPRSGAKEVTRLGRPSGTFHPDARLNSENAARCRGRAWARNEGPRYARGAPDGGG